ncbi:MAG: O-sialoglycoprotein endopeptidase [bacterium]
MTNVILGMDSSCYTTSVAVISQQGDIMADWRQVLSVKPGTIGLRQREALFQHWQNFPVLLQNLKTLLDHRIMAVACSHRPTNHPNSYMPVFTAATSVAQSLAAALDVPVYSFSHQEGHLAAGRLGAKGPYSSSFLAVHLSGGTSELLMVQEKSSGLDISVLGKTLDLNAGQFVDRVGVALGLPFPSGQALENVAQTDLSGEQPIISSYTNGYDVSFSGPTTKALNLLSKNVNKAALARAVFRCIANTIEKVLLKATADLGVKNVLLVGGVAANNFIRERLRNRLEHPAVGIRLFFTSPELSTDNAVGIAHLGFLTIRRRGT